MHYIYVNNNPVKANDPSGHCKRNPENKNEDSECWKVYDDLKNTYKSVTIDPNFDYAFLSMIGQSLKLTLNAFNNDMGKFQKALGNFSFDYQPLVSRAVTPPGLNTIFLGDTTVIQNNAVASDAVGVITHEIGHIFDFHKPAGSNNGPLKSQSFIDEFSPSGCNVGALGCVGSGASDLYKTKNSVTGGGTSGYNPSGNPSPYGSTSSIDDFAESFSGYVLRQNGLQTNIPPDPKRDLIMATWINLAGK